MIRYYIYIIIFIQCLFCQANQKFIYKTKFKSFNVGNTEITIQNSTLDTVQKLITIESKTNKWLDLIYKLRHYSTIIINNTDYSLLAMTQKAEQADYVDSYSATVNYDKQIIHYQSFKDLNNDSQAEESIIPFSGIVYEPFAIVYYLQTLALDLNYKYLFNYYSKKNIKSLELEVVNIENIKTPYVTKPCYVVVPQSQDGKYLLKNKGEMKIWYTADEDQIPIKIQQKMRHGIMELILEEYIEE